MCGFVGIFDAEGTSMDTLQQMTESLHHRGPNDSGLVCLDPTTGKFIEANIENALPGNYPVSMGFRRLSILDLSLKGHQPMLTDDNRFVITYNGETYNFQELREDLIKQGISFRGGSDTEVILNLYAKYGPKMLAKLNGMFALSIYDKKTNSLFLARDRMGIKPLYFHYSGSRLIYASEVKAFLFHPSFHPELNDELLSEFFLFRYISGEDSLLKGVASVPPGAFMIFHDGKISTQYYWRIPPHKTDDVHRGSEEQELEELMHSSVKYQLRSDVKVGCQLSGGIDSTLISHWARKITPDFQNSISVVFRDPEFSEEPYINEVNKELGLLGHKITFDINVMLQTLRRATWHNDFPLSQPNCLGIFFLATEANRFVKVLLTGEGADEVFGGYPRFYLASWLVRLKRIPLAGHMPILKGQFGFAARLEESLVGLSAVGSSDDLSKIYPEFNPRQALERRLSIFFKIREENLLERLLTYEQQTYLVDLLMRQDKMCMAGSVENRVPFLDHRVVEFSKRIPTTQKLGTPFLPKRYQGKYHTKKIIKKLASNYYPKSFVFRSKCGFRLPLQELFNCPDFRSVLEEIVPVLRIFDFISEQQFWKLYRDAQNRGGKYLEMFWSVLAFVLWWDVLLKKG